MSGGHFQYKQHHLEDIAESIQSEIDNQGQDNGWGGKRTEWPEDIVKLFQEGIKHLRVAAVYAQRIDWLLSGDDGEEQFKARLKSDLAKLENDNA